MIPTIRQILDIYGLRAQKQLSQNFILNGALLDRIARLLTDTWPKPSETSLVIEIGPGPGSLTRSLLKITQPAKVLAIELDKRFEPVLNVQTILSVALLIDSYKQLKESHGHRFTPVFEDALTISLKEMLRDDHGGSTVAAPDTVSIVGNLPFGVASLIFQKLIKEFESDQILIQHQFLLMFQKEVAERIVAKPGTKPYGRLSIVAQNAYNVEVPLIVSKNDFTPKPKVDAAVIRFRSNGALGRRPTSSNISHLTSKLFQRPNRMVAGILKDEIKDFVWDETLPLHPSTRPKAITIQQYQLLCNWLEEKHLSFFK